MEYIQNDWTPKAFAIYKIKKIAFITPEMAIARLSQKRANEGSKIPIEHFKNASDALVWLS
jgi:hypothetical protein